MSGRKKISIIIPNLDGRVFLEDCLSSLRRQTFGDFEVVLVDNGSADDSISLARRKFPEAVIHCFGENKGFSAAVNKGIELAGGEYLFLLNNDTELREDCLEAVNDFLDAHPEASFAAVKMLFQGDRRLINDAGDVFSIYGLAHQRGKGEADDGQYDRVEPVFGACAGAAVYRREIFEQIGSFDEDFFAYLEDVDFSFRAQIAGKKCFYLPKAVVYHVDGGTSRKLHNFSRFLTLRNSLYVIYKDFPWFLLVILSPFLLLSQIRNIFVGLKHRCPGLVLRVYGDFFRHLPDLRQKRRQIQASRRVSLFYLFGILSKKYPFSLGRSFYDFFFDHR